MTVWPAHCIGIGRSSATHTVTLILSKVQSPPDPLHKPKALLRVRERAQKVPAIFGATSLETLGHTTDEFMHIMPNGAPRTASEWGEPASREWHTRII